VGSPPVTALLASQVSDGDTVALGVSDGRLELTPVMDAEPVKETRRVH